MARKSRKNIPEVVSSATVQTEVSRPFRAGLYARISMETEETLERGTIETQVELMKNFVADTEDIAVAEIYKDSDYSGTNFDRPGFTQMMEDIKHTVYFQILKICFAKKEFFEMYSVPTALCIFYLSSFFLYIKIHIGEAKQCKKKEHLYFKMRMVHGDTSPRQ